MLAETAVRAAMRRQDDYLEPWIVEAFDATGNVVQTWSRRNCPVGLMANIERKLQRREALTRSTTQGGESNGR